MGLSGVCDVESENHSNKTEMMTSGESFEVRVAFFISHGSKMARMNFLNFKLTHRLVYGNSFIEGW